MQLEKFKLTCNRGRKHDIPCYRLHIDIYKCSVVVMSRAQSRRLDSLWVPCDYAMQCRDYLADNGEVLITINEWTDEDMAHEIHHAVDMVMKYIGHNKIRPCEPSAYLYGYIYKNIMKKRSQLIK